MDPLAFVKQLKVTLTKRLVLIMQNRNFNLKHGEKLFKNNLGYCQFVAKLYVGFIFYYIHSSS